MSLHGYLHTDETREGIDSVKYWMGRYARVSGHNNITVENQVRNVLLNSSEHLMSDQ